MKLEAVELSQNSIGSTEDQSPREKSENHTTVSIIPAETQALPQINGRLLTPEEGCGFSPMRNTRIIGGGAARNGKHKTDCIGRYLKIVNFHMKMHSD